MSQNHVFICDEFYDALVKTKLELVDKRINPIFYIGVEE